MSLRSSLTTAAGNHQPGASGQGTHSLRSCDVCLIEKAEAWSRIGLGEALFFLCRLAAIKEV